MMLSNDDRRGKQVERHSREDATRDWSTHVATGNAEERDTVVRALLRAVRDFGDAHDQMSLNLKGDMDMNATDVAALRHLIMSENAGVSVTPADLSRKLGISTASTTKLIDRLSASGYMARAPHPTDRRSRTIVLTRLARDDFWRTFGARMRSMAAAANEFTMPEMDVATRIFNAMALAINPVVTREK